MNLKVISKIKKFLDVRRRLSQESIQKLNERVLLGLVFVPGVCLILVGALVVFAPHLLFGLMAMLSMFFGVLFCVVAVKFIQLRHRFLQLTQRLEARLYIQPAKGMSIRATDGDMESKKIVYH